MVGQSVALKGLALLVQVVLARLLLKEDFGLFGLCLAFSAVASLIRQAGVQQVLIQRGRRFGLWAGPAFWFTLSTALAGSAFLLAAGPIAAGVYDEPELRNLLWLLALEPPLTALGMLPRAHLTHQMRFCTLTRLALPAELVRAGALVGLALLGLGAMSFVLSRLIYAGTLSAALWLAARPRVRLRPRLSRWKHLLADGGYALGAEAIFLVIAQGDYVILGLLASTAVVGVYYFAFNLSTQAVVMLTTNLQQVLLPAMSRLRDEPARQWSAYERAAGVLALAGGLIAAVQAAAAPAGVPLVFGSRWNEAVPILQALAPALLLRLVWPLTVVTLQGRRDFRAIFLRRCVTGPLFVLVVGVGAWFDGARGAAIGVGLHALCELAVFSARAAGGWASGLGSMRRALLGPGVAGLLAAGAGLAVDAALSSAGTGPLWLAARTAVVIGVCVMVYAAAAGLMCRDALREMAALGMRSARVRRAAPWLRRFAERGPA